MTSAWSPEWLVNSCAFRKMTAWRGVEAQYLVPTMRLVDTPAEQELLEQLLEGTKPPLPEHAEEKHYLLMTPFRYTPHHAHRFRPATENGQWYGAATVEGACAELAYWRNRFILDSVGLRDTELISEYGFYPALVRGSAIDLTEDPWVQNRPSWTHGSDYSACHALAKAARDVGVQWIRYESVRAPGTPCAVVFTPDGLFEPVEKIDRSIQRWSCKASRSRVMFTTLGQPGFVWDF
ncbi:RES family NAD+ phosphorylase [Ottowia thiooxydans]|uniref:RES family NAD+ phosphorylase n=1 Tax=Ottowia thiooxydans TaxID=219182 RepID=UPI000404925A|nr:RES family NAD+ phosphorylase [Ottowia thiooxydans]